MSGKIIYDYLSYKSNIILKNMINRYANISTTQAIAFFMWLAEKLIKSSWSS